MDQGRTINKISESIPEGSGRMGRPRLRWLEGVGKDLQEMFKRWRQKAVYRDDWAM
jgi:hypothetical protein